MRKYFKLNNESLGLLTEVKLPLNVSGEVFSPNANTATIDDVIRDATKCNPLNISNLYNVKVLSVIGVDTSGIDLNTDSYNGLYNVINELNNRAKSE